MSEEKVACFWDTNGEAETLFYETIDDAIEMYLDGVESLKGAPGKITVYGYARRVVKPDSFYGYVLGNLLERLDEDYRADDDYTKETDEMKSAEKEFVDTIVALYESWSCEIVKTETVDRDEWIKKMRPDWVQGG
jgi:hypothetical protein